MILICPFKFNEQTDRVRKERKYGVGIKIGDKKEAFWQRAKGGLARIDQMGWPCVGADIFRERLTWWKVDGNCAAVDKVYQSGREARV